MAQHYRAVPKPGKIIKATNKPKIKAVVQQRKPVQKVVASKPKTITTPKQATKNARKAVQNYSTKQERIKKEQLNKQLRRTPYNPTRDINVNAINKLKNVGVGRTLVMLACGPSINEVDFAPLFDHPLIDLMCINKPNAKAWAHTKYWAFCDQSQYNRNTDLFFSCSQTILNSTAVKARRAEKQTVIKSVSGNGFSRDLTRGYHIGRSTVYANMQTALWMNYDKVYIFGIDMCEVGGQLHFYGVNPDVKPSDRVKRFKIESDHYLRAYHIMKEEERAKFKICTSYNKWEFAELFGKIDHKIAINIILGRAKNVVYK